MAIASHLGKRRRSIPVNAGHTSAVSRIAISSGMTSSLSWITSQIPTPTAAAITRNRHAYAAARCSPGGMPRVA